MKYLLITNHRREHTTAMAEQVAAWLKARSIECDIDDGREEASTERYDVMIVLGGDGTMLRAARRYGQSQTPILGVNLGTVGSMSNIEASELPDYLPRVIAGQYGLENRLMLTVQVFNGEKLQAEYQCLNEAAVKAAGARMIRFEVQIDDGPAYLYRGDGLMVSTPTGSSGYSLSAGGPLLDPGMMALVMVPLAPNMLSWKPLVLNPDRRVRLRSLKWGQTMSCLDGQVCLFSDQENWVEITRARHLLPLIKLKEKPFLQSINSRLLPFEGLSQRP